MDLQAKRENLMALRSILAYDLVALETEYENTPAENEESLTYLKHKIEDKEGELFANSACLAALNHRLEEKI